MNGTGYGDKERLAAARELAASFGSGRGNSRGSSAARGNAQIRVRLPPPPPPTRPSGNVAQLNHSRPASSVRQQSYPRRVANAGPGPILGTRAMNFLSRQDEATTSPASSQPVSSEAGRVENAAGVATTANVAAVPTPAPLMSSPLISLDDNTSGATTNGTHQRANAGDSLLRGNATEGCSPTFQSTPQGSSMPTSTSMDPSTGTTPPPLIEFAEPTSSNIADAWFSFMQRGSMPLNDASEDANDLTRKESSHSGSPTPSDRPVAQYTSQYQADLSTLSAPQANLVTAPNDATTIACPAINGTARLNRPTASGPELEQEGHDSGPSRVNETQSATGSSPGGKTDSVKSNEAGRLRPEAPGFVPGRVLPTPYPPETTSEDLIDLTPHDPEEVSPEISPLAQLSAREELLPSMPAPTQANSLHATLPFSPAPAQLLTHNSTTTFVPTGPSSGHLITVTPIDFANEVPVSVTTNGQHPQPVSRRPVQRKPTQGLSGSMWAR